ncbi:MAG: hypothetical protein LC624_05910, partial [Halobacteriales archaeon]|nr:hypothetical protein [Halobacteriales archaeon]
CYTAPYLLRKLGCKVVGLNAQPDGTFPGHESEPVADNAKQLMAACQALRADAGFIQDGDADRAIFVDEQARYVIGDHSLALMASTVVARRKGGLVVTPVSTSSAVEDMVKAKGGRVMYTRVGSPTVANAMKRENAIFGGEENGGLIWPEHQHVRDGLFSIARMLELMAQTGKPMSSLLADVPKYANVKQKVHVSDAAKPRILERFAAQQKGKVDTTDGIKVLHDDGWVLVRASGTEPLIRIFGESKREDRARQLVEESKASIERLAKELGGH